mmetsp:Transcript_18038/g.23739  ORF Transcript_18038/g.23739 Transcript_18038/m.23739 type:complete len:231 (-) Transcript_18038:565-1257(-)
MIFYILSKPILKKMCKVFGWDGKSEAFKWFTILHSAMLSIFSGWVVYHSYRAVWKTYSEDGLMTVYCNHDNKLWNNGLGSMAIIFYLSKFYEYVDTWILIIKGKKVSWLQGYHHAIAVPSMWSVTVSQAPGLVPFICLNALVHTVMYCYYAFAALGYRSPLKKLITVGQLVQFFTGITMCMPHFYIGDICTNVAQRAGQGFVQIVAVLLIVLFANFFIQAYLKKSAKKNK